MSLATLGGEPGGKIQAQIYRAQAPFFEPRFVIAIAKFALDGPSGCAPPFLCAPRIDYRRARISGSSEHTMLMNTTRPQNDIAQAEPSGSSIVGKNAYPKAFPPIARHSADISGLKIS